MSRRIIVLGVSTYSEFLLRTLRDIGGVETVAVDMDEERINAVTDYVDVAKIGNANRYDLLQQLGVADADEVIVALGDLAASLICVVYLKDLDCKRIVAKALNNEHARILSMLGVQDIVFPEKSMAENTANILVHPWIRHFRLLNEEESMMEMKVPAGLVGKTLRDLACQEKYEANVTHIIHAGGRLTAAPSAETTLADGDTLMLTGRTRKLYEFERFFIKHASE